MIRMRLGQGRLRVEGLDPHRAHEPAHASAADLVPHALQGFGHFPRPVEGQLRIEGVDEPHEAIVVGMAHRRIVQARPREAEQFGLSGHREDTILVPVDAHFPLPKG